MPVSFATDIRPLFTQVDIDHMQFFCDLSNYNDVKTNADDILGRLKGKGGPMMPPANAGGPWPESQIALFQSWVDEGCNP